MKQYEAFMHHKIISFLMASLLMTACQQAKKERQTTPNAMSSVTASQAGSFALTDPESKGCIDNRALNFNSKARFDDGSCQYSYFKCKCSYKPVPGEEDLRDSRITTGEYEFSCKNHEYNGEKLTTCFSPPKPGNSESFPGWSSLGRLTDVIGSVHCDNSPGPIIQDGSITSFNVIWSLINCEPAGGTAVDSDADGVNDDLDQCPGTTFGVAVNSVGCPTDPEPPVEGPDPGPVNPSPDSPSCGIQGGSVIYPQDAALSEKIEIPGTDFTFEYFSKNLAKPGQNTYQIPVKIPSPIRYPTAANLKVVAFVAGRTIEQSPGALQSNMGQIIFLNWDGKDVFGRDVPGSVEATIRLSYWAKPDAFASYDQSTTGLGQTANPSNPKINLASDDYTLFVKEYKTIVGSNTFDEKMGGWTLNVYHHLDVTTKILYKGDGQVLNPDNSQGRFLSNGNYFIPDTMEPLIFRFNTNGQHLQTIDRITNAVLLSFQYDPSGYLIAITDNDGNITRLNRNSQGYLTSVVNPFGVTTQISLDNLNRLSQVTRPDNAVHILNYFDDVQSNLLRKYTKPSGFASEFSFDGNGRLKADTDAEGGIRTISFGRTPAPQFNPVTYYRSPENRTTVYQTLRTSSGGQVSKVTLPTKLIDQTIINQSQSQMVSTHHDGTRTTINRALDPRFGLYYVTKNKTVQMPSGLSMQTTIDETDDFADINDPMSLNSWTKTVQIKDIGTFSTTYQVGAEKLTLTSSSGRSEQAQFDHGRVASVAVGSLTPITTTYDANGRVSRIDQGDRRTSYSYDSNGYLARTTNPLGQEYQFTNDVLGRTTRIQYPDGHAVNLTYDANGNVTQVQVPSQQVYQYTFDKVDRETYELQPSVNSETFATQTTYNKDNDVTSHTLPNNNQIVPSYDGAGRLSSITTSEGIYGFKYDLLRGKLQTQITPYPDLDTTEYQWDGALLTRMTWKQDSLTLGSVGFTYDAGFRVASMNVQGVDVSYQYNADGLPTQAGDVTILRDASTGLMTQTTLGVIGGSYAYNTFGEPETNTYTSNGTPLLSFSYQRDKLGRITQRTTTDRQGAVKVQTYSYDTLGRLSTETGGASITYTYDDNGNRLNNSSFYDAQDRLVENADFFFFYDKSGFLAEKKRKSDNKSIFYSYDSFGRLLKVDDRTTSKVVEYVIDGEGRRIARKLNGTFTHGWIYKDSLKPVGELEFVGSAWQLKNVFIYGSNSHSPDAVVSVSDNKTYRVISDHLGSPRIVVNAATGEIVEERDYDTWGNVITDSNPGLLMLGYAGGLYDPDTGLVRFGARDYDPSIGRWLDKDPIGLDGGYNQYAYVENDTLNYLDSNGEGPKGIVLGASFGGITTGIAGAIAAGGACTLMAPGVGTISCGVAGFIEGAAYGTGAGAAIGYVVEEFCSSISTMFSGGGNRGNKGERNKAARPDGTDNPFKKLKPVEGDPRKVKYKDPHTGKDVEIAKPEGFDEWWAGKRGKK